MKQSVWAEKQKERATVGGAVVGAGATWTVGAMMGAPAGPVGIAVGAVVGGVVGLVYRWEEVPDCYGLHGIN